MAHLRLFLFQSFQVTLAGKPVTGFRSAKTQALLAYLAVEADRPHRREVLAGLLWPDQPDQVALHNLSQTLLNLRQAIGDREASPPFLSITRQNIQFNPASDHELDVAAFTALLAACETHPHPNLNNCQTCMQRLQQAVELYRGPFLAEFFLPDSDLFEEWALLKREWLHRQAIEALERLAEYYERQDDTTSAQRYALRQTELDPLREAAHRHLMRLLALSGQRSMALAQYETCRRLLADELGVEPAEETKALVERIRAEEPGAVALSPLPPRPYRGLFAFREEDAIFFFGREAFTARLVEAVHRQSIVAAIGSSGSGKSSVVFSGLIPRLRQPVPTEHPSHITPPATHWTIVAFRPGSRPFYALAAALAPLLEPQLSETEQLIETRKLAEAVSQEVLSLSDVVSRILLTQGGPDVGQLLLIVDQFEEIYTLCPEPEVRRSFLDRLLEAVEARSDRRELSLVLVLTLRADFMGQALTHRPFADALQDADVKIGPMTREELGRAIENPARRQGVAFEAGLVERILDDVGDEPGNLPLLQFALTSLWERQTAGSLLTHRAYEAIGRVEGALARYADEVYAGLSQAEQESARRVFVQMVHPGEGTEDTRRLATRTELGEDNWALVQRLADARLVVTGRNPTGQETVEIVHEALIRNWGQLRAWMNEDRAFRIWQERLRVALRQWEASGRDEGALLRGTLLAEAEEWAKARAADLNPLEDEFLHASVSLRAQEVLAAEAQRQRELAQAQSLAEEQKRRAEAESQRAETQARASRRLRALAAGLAIVFLLAVVAAVLAIGQRNEAEQHARLALARQLTAQVTVLRGVQPDLALLLSLEAIRTSDTLEAETDSLLSPQYTYNLTTFLHDHTDGVLSVAFSPDGQTFASSGRDETVILWDVSAEFTLSEAEGLNTGVTSGRPPSLRSRLTGHKGNVTSVGFSPDGQTLASGGDFGAIILWDVETGQPLGSPLSGHASDSNVWRVAFSPDGRMLASGADDSTIILWDVESSRPLGRPLTSDTGIIRSIAFSPDGQTLASTSDGDIMLWDVSPKARLDAARSVATVPEAIGSPLSGAERAGVVTSLAFSPDGETLASGRDDGAIILWDMATGERLGRPLSGHTESVSDLVFSPDGRILAASSRDNTISLWDVETLESFGPPLIGPEVVSSLAFSPDGRTLASGIDNKTIMLWNMAARQSLIGHEQWVDQVAFSPDSRILASGSDDDTVRLWDVPARRPLGQPLTGHTSDVLAIAFSPNGRTVASGSADSTVILWDVATRKPLSPPLAGHSEWISSVAFSPDGRTLASSSGDKTIILWDAEGARTGRPVGSPLTGHTDAVLKVAFSPAERGQRLASSSVDKTIILWDAATRQPIDPPLVGHTDEVWGLAFSPNGQTLASIGNDKTVILWDVATHRPLGPPLIGHTDQIWNVAFSPDGRMLASVGRDNTIILWDVATRRPLGPPLTGHTDWVSGVAFSPDGQTLASSGRDHTIILWQVNDQPWPARACRIANRNLTQAEWSQFIGSDVPYQPTCPARSVPPGS